MQKATGNHSAKDPIEYRFFENDENDGTVSSKKYRSNSPPVGLLGEDNPRIQMQRKTYVQNSNVEYKMYEED